MCRVLAVQAGHANGHVHPCLGASPPSLLAPQAHTGSWVGRPGQDVQVALGPAAAMCSRDTQDSLLCLPRSVGQLGSWLLVIRVGDAISHCIWHLDFHRCF